MLVILEKWSRNMVGISKAIAAAALSQNRIGYAPNTTETPFGKTVQLCTPVRGNLPGNTKTEDCPVWHASRPATPQDPKERIYVGVDNAGAGSDGVCYDARGYGKVHDIYAQPTVSHGNSYFSLDQENIVQTLVKPGENTETIYASNLILELNVSDPSVLNKTTTPNSVDLPAGFLLGLGGLDSDACVDIVPQPQLDGCVGKIITVNQVTDKQTDIIYLGFDSRPFDGNETAVMEAAGKLTDYVYSADPFGVVQACYDKGSSAPSAQASSNAPSAQANSSAPSTQPSAIPTKAPVTQITAGPSLSPSNTFGLGNETQTVDTVNTTETTPSINVTNATEAPSAAPSTQPSPIGDETSSTASRKFSSPLMAASVGLATLYASRT